MLTIRKLFSPTAYKHDLSSQVLPVFDRPGPGVCRLSLLLACSLFMAISFSLGCDADDDNNDQTCQILISKATECFNNWCTNAGAGTGTCLCWEQEMDINPATCSCTPLYLNLLCEFVDLDKINPYAYNCNAATDFIDDTCVDLVSRTPDAGLYLHDTGPLLDQLTRS